MWCSGGRATNLPRNGTSGYARPYKLNRVRTGVGVMGKTRRGSSPERLVATAATAAARLAAVAAATAAAAIATTATTTAIAAATAALTLRAGFVHIQRAAANFVAIDQLR